MGRRERLHEAMNSVDAQIQRTGKVKLSNMHLVEEAIRHAILNPAPEERGIDESRAIYIERRGRYIGYCNIEVRETAFGDVNCVATVFDTVGNWFRIYDQLHTYKSVSLNTDGGR